MVIAAGILAPQAGAMAVEKGFAGNTNVTSGGVMAVYNKPAANMTVTYGGADVVYRKTAANMPVTQAGVMAVVRGVVDSPKLRTWGFTLDGHDMFVIKLGTYGKTLVYDLTTGTWSWWATSGTNRWRASIGLNWYSAFQIPSTYGSNVIVGDDSYGALWVLSPEKGYDDAPEDATIAVPFDRIAVGQLPTRGRGYPPVYSVYLTASLGAPAVTANTVTLEYSDDQGNTFNLADGTYTVTAGDYGQEFAWRSLGRLSPPGRLFRVTDNGAFARIDSLDVNTDNDLGA